jgi:hypothetical protein
VILEWTLQRFGNDGKLDSRLEEPSVGLMMAVERRHTDVYTCELDSHSF